LAGVDHALLALELLRDDAAAAKQSLAVLGLLVLLDDGAEAAAAGEGNVGEAAALKVVLVADLGALHDEGDDGKANAGGTDEEKARGVDGLVALKVAVLVDAVVSLAKGNAGQAPGDQASVDWVVEGPNGVVPGLGAFRGLGVDSLTRLGHEVAKALAPTSDVLLVDGAAAGGLLLWGGHDKRLGEKRESKGWVSN